MANKGAELALGRPGSTSVRAGFGDPRGRYAFKLGILRQRLSARLVHGCGIPFYVMTQVEEDVLPLPFIPSPKTLHAQGLLGLEA